MPRNTDKLMQVDVGDVDDMLSGEDSQHAPEQITFHRLARTYILADKLGDTLTANMVIDTFFDFSDSSGYIPLQLPVGLVFDGRCAVEKLQMLVVDYYVHEATEKTISWLDESDEAIPQAFLVAVLKEDTRLKVKEGSKPGNKIF